MDTLIPDIQDIVYKYIHKFYMSELAKELPKYIYRIELEKFEENKYCVYAMLGKSCVVRSKTANRKIYDEISRQKHVDEGFCSHYFLSRLNPL